MVFIKRGEFILNGLSGNEDLYCFIEEYPNVSYPKRKLDVISVAGASEDIILDENSFENRTIELKVFVKAENQEQKTLRVARVVSEFSKGNYSDLILYSEPNFKYKVISNSEISLTKPGINSEYTELYIKLTAGAFKYYQPEQKITLSNNTTFSLENPYPFPAKPLISTNTNAGDLILNINDEEFRFHHLFTKSTIDSLELIQSVKDPNGNETINGYDYMQDFPQLSTGINQVKVSNSVTLYPRWRTL